MALCEPSPSITYGQQANWDQNWLLEGPGQRIGPDHQVESASDLTMQLPLEAG